MEIGSIVWWILLLDNLFSGNLNPTNKLNNKSSKVNRIDFVSKLNASKAGIDDNPKVKSTVLNVSKAGVYDNPKVKSTALNVSKAGVDDNPKVKSTALNVSKASVDDNPKVKSTALNVSKASVDDNPKVKSTTLNVSKAGVNDNPKVKSTALNVSKAGVYDNPKVKSTVLNVSKAGVDDTRNIKFVVRNVPKPSVLNSKLNVSNLFGNYKPSKLQFVTKPRRRLNLIRRRRHKRPIELFKQYVDDYYAHNNMINGKDGTGPIGIWSRMFGGVKALVDSMAVIMMSLCSTVGIILLVICCCITKAYRKVFDFFRPTNRLKFLQSPNIRKNLHELNQPGQMRQLGRLVQYEPSDEELRLIAKIKKLTTYETIGNEKQKKPDGEKLNIIDDEGKLK